MASPPLPFIAVFAGFWWLVVGLFAAMQVATAWRVVDAGLRFRPATATVLESGVRTSSDSDGTTYAPRLRYRYRVDGRDCEGDRYDFGGGSSSSDRRWSGRVAAAHPPGSALAIWYDPAEPGSAVVERRLPRHYWFVWMFLQPFLVVSAGLLAALLLLVRERRRRRRCLREGWAPGWTVPGWGTVHDTGAGLRLGALRGRGVACAAAVGSHGIACFVAVFPMAFIAGDGDEPWSSRGIVVAGILLASASLAVAVGVITYRTRRPAWLVIDERARRIALHAGAVDFDEPWSALTGWATERREASDGEGGKSVAYDLRLGVQGRAPVTVKSWDEPEVAVHVAKQVAAATATPFLSDHVQDLQRARDRRRLEP